MKRINLIYTLIASTMLLTNCKKNEISQDKLPNNNSAKQASGGDGKWDLLGYGLKATGDLQDNGSISDVSVIDINKFETDFKNKFDNTKVDGIDVNTSTEGSEDLFFGSSAYNYAKEISKKKSFDINGNASIPTGDTSTLNFTGSFKKNNSDKNASTYSSRFSYASYEFWHRVKRIRFTQDVSTSTLIQYLTPQFKTNLTTISADSLVKRYGTHVMLDISIGGRLRINYSGEMKAESSQEQKSSGAKVGLGVSLLKVFGVNINTDKSKEEITKISNETSSKQYTGKYYGGTNGGKSINIDNNGNTSENINFASWQQSITDRNAALIDVGKAIFIYDLITDPTKKAQVKTAVEKYIKERQVIELGEVPVYGLYFDGTKHHNLARLDNHVLSLYPNNEDPKMGNDGVYFYAFKENKPGTVPVYRYRNDQINNNFFTTQFGNYSGYRLEYIAFYAYPSSSASDPSITPIYRYWSTLHMDHYYTPINKNYINYSFEKIEFYGIKAN
ncbi:MAG: MAC/perforin domain-containing protein [Sphingobacterium sp.]